MKFITSLVLLAGLTSTYAAPAAIDPAQKEFQSDLKKAMEPIQSEVRSLFENGKVAAEDLAKGLSEASNNVVQAGKSLLTPAENIDRASLGEEIIQNARNFGKQVQDNARNLLTRAAADVNPMMVNERSALVGLKDAVNMLENKYLTPDGQDIPKLLMKIVGV